MPIVEDAENNLTVREFEFHSVEESDGGRWYIPYYIDVGTGNSEWTTSANLGIGYLYDWGNIAFVWRDLRYKQGNDEFLRKFQLDGPSFNIGW